MSNDDKLSELKRIAGARAFEELCDALGGEDIHIPRAFLGGCANITERNKAIRQEYYNGADKNGLAEKWQLSNSHIDRIITALGL